MKTLLVHDLRQLSTAHGTSKCPILVISASGNRVTAGPLYIPGRSACHACLAHGAATAGFDKPAAEDPSAGALEAATEIAREISAILEGGGEAQDFYRSVCEFDLESGTRLWHPVFSRQDCICSPGYGDTDELTVHCSPLTGIVRSVEVTGEPFLGAHAAVCQFVSPLPMPGTRLLLRAQFAVGKGHTKQQAVESCIGEALERYSLIFDGTEPLRRARLTECGGIDPRDILLVNERQYETRDEWNASHDARYWVPEPFDAEQALDLVDGKSLLTGESVPVPAACCLMWFPFKPGEARIAAADSIGCASGRTLAQATASALLEWIERDATAIWWYNRLRRPGVRSASFGSTELTAVEKGLAAGGRQLYLLDVKTDLDISTYVAVAPRADGREPVFAAAAHPSPAVAALKAALEVSQICFTAARFRDMDAEYGTWLFKTNAHNEPWLLPSRFVDAPAHIPARFKDAPAGNASEHVELCVAAMVAAGLHPVAVDQSRPDVLLKTVRAVVPGLRHIWARFAPGRLYDVPVRLNWLPEKTAEQDLNPELCML